jgi:DNA-binding response OmpR family regulator
MEPTRESTTPDLRGWHRPTILHIEDDPTLAFLVRHAFEDFGFRGTIVVAESVQEARALLNSSNRHGQPLDMILCDMTLPDGSGFDIITEVKSLPEFSTTPVLMLSSEFSPETVNRAYALGANCYVPKSRDGKSINNVMRSQYTHWLEDVALPPSSPPDRLKRILARDAAALVRRADCHMRVAKLFKDAPEEMSLWLTLSLGESNTANLVSFVQKQVSEADLPFELIDGLVRDYKRVVPFIEAAEMHFDRIERIKLPARDDVYRFMVPLLSHLSAENLAKALSYGFPNYPVVMQAILETVYENYGLMANWVTSHSEDQDIRNEAAKIRDERSGSLHPRIAD